MTIVSRFYTGFVDNIEWAQSTRKLAYRYVVGSVNQFRVTADGGTVRGLNISAGTAHGGGIEDTSDAVEPLALPFNAADRWYLVGLRRVWGATNATIVDHIEGTATKQVPSRPTSPGVEDFHPLALCFVPAGGGTVTSIADLRVFTDNGGICIGLDDLTRSFMNQVGTRIRIGTIEWTRILNSSEVASWVSVDTADDTGWVSIPDSLPSPWTSSLEARKQGKFVTLRGGFFPSGTVWGSINNPQTLVNNPAEFAPFIPSKTVTLIAARALPASAQDQFRITVQSNGQIVGRCSVTNDEHGVLIDITYRVD